ncbi:SUR7-domain-containing protein [Xylona heveae TC161]|uniref:SUR7-domain-containing protein n=1 Tax=Xylona heveae (strain CBS 132557 / TC161) TaxID=1328760 RepID=A0A164ZLA3_XYLHT|nr:SUR7-domain-containing protein [Xylona heveae TC161]KZF19236.1 SUR7-domain-containing protein [Xylona heveae TC161]
MGAARPGIAFVSLFLTAGALLLMFFVILGGAKNHNPLNDIYFLQVNTRGIPNAQTVSRWTMYHICGVVNGNNVNCGKSHPAYPFDPPRNFGTQVDIPSSFIGTHKYYYMSRFMFAFFLIALFFGICSLFLGLLAMCSRLGGAISGFMCSVSLFFQTIAAALMTACYVLGRKHFRNAGHSASLGVRAFAFTWTAVACLFLSTILFCMTALVGRKSETTYTRRSKGSFFSRKRSTRSRGSFVDNESQRRVKDEYA